MSEQSPTPHEAPPEAPLAPHTTEAVGHQKDYVDTKAVILGFIGLGCLIVTALFFLNWLWMEFSLQQARIPSAWRRGERPPVSSDQPAQLRALHEWEQKELESYGWQDDDKTTAHIPVERAMQLLVSHGDPFGAAGKQPTEIEPAQQPAKNEPADPGNLPKEEAERATSPSPERQPKEKPPATDADSNQSQGDPGAIKD